MERPIPSIVLVGLSGAGKSAALQYLKTLGYFCIDSIPPSLYAHSVDRLRAERSPVAIGLELNHPDWLADFAQLPLGNTRTLFLDASDTALVQRFSANRRRHPLADRGAGPLAAIQQERQLLAAIRPTCDFYLDTSHLSLRQLHAELDRLACGDLPSSLTVTLSSFGFKYGLPADANLVFDIRFLPNPYYVAELRSLTGQDDAIQTFLFGDAVARSTYARIRDTVLELLPHYRAERRTHLLVAIGCTGGQHRSVAFVERLATDLRASSSLDSAAYPLQIAHRHLATSQAEIAALPPVISIASNTGTGDRLAVGDSPRV